MKFTSVVALIGVATTADSKVKVKSANENLSGLLSGALNGDPYALVVPPTAGAVENQERHKRNQEHLSETEKAL